jgi:hypothetical protein
MIIFAMPMVMLAANLVQFDRMLGHAFLQSRPKAATRCSGSTSSGSSATPRFYFIFVPALGFISAIVPTVRAAASVRPRRGRAYR